MTPHEDSDSLQIVPDPDKLDRYHRQQLSAMLDGELSPDQARFMLRRLQHDAELAGCWERWQVGGDVLRGQRNALLPADFAQKVSAAIAGDVEVPEARAGGGPRLLRWGGGAALAASVAMAALLVGRQAGIEPDQAPLQVVPQLAATEAPAPAGPVPVTTDSPSESGAGAAVLLAGSAAAVAGASAPRAAGRGQAQQAAAARPAEGSRSAAVAAPAVAVAANQPVPGPAPAAREPQPVREQAPAALFAGLSQDRQGIGADPFEALPMTVASRPWPRATAGAAGDYAVGFGSMMPAAPAWPAAAGQPPQMAVELFGLPAGTGPALPPATAIGAGAHDAHGAGQAARAADAGLPGPR